MYACVDEQESNETKEKNEWNGFSISLFNRSNDLNVSWGREQQKGLYIMYTMPLPNAEKSLQ